MEEVSKSLLTLVDGLTPLTKENQTIVDLKIGSFTLWDIRNLDMED